MLSLINLIQLLGDMDALVEEGHTDLIDAVILMLEHTGASKELKELCEKVTELDDLIKEIDESMASNQ